ncbi:MAG: HepT-like ribonuclease domain-containing protein [Acidobacteriota bacterium]
MAGYRNRLIHFYSEITTEEMHKIICEHLDDFGKFNEFIKKVLKFPGKYKLKIE